MRLLAAATSLGEADRLYSYSEVRRLTTVIYTHVGSARELLDEALDPLRRIRPRRIQEVPTSGPSRREFALAVEVRRILSALGSIDVDGLTDAVLPVVDGAHAQSVGVSSRVILWQVTTPRECIATAREAASDLLLLLADPRL